MTGRRCKVTIMANLSALRKLNGNCTGASMAMEMAALQYFAAVV
jgi:hypothetical protein